MGKLTPEQKEIVSTGLSGDDLLKIIAYAGTGKTTTLASYALNRPQNRFLYVAFNKSMQLDAARKFPSNVRCRTAHALAFPGFGSRYKHKLGNPRVHEVADALDTNRYDLAKAALDTLVNFTVSPDRSLNETHRAGEIQHHGHDPLELADRLWQRMCDEQDDAVPMLHDGYLKLFQLSDPQLHYDGILLDEAQDTNPVTSALLLRQNRPRILVGDPHQQIYSFRGAVDAMDLINSTRVSFLTQSFRFNQIIADLANVVLQTFKGELHRIKGVGENGKIGKVRVPYTLIARTNAGLFDEAVTHYRNHAIAYLGTQGLPFRSILDGYWLAEGKPEKVRDPFLKRFGHFDALKEYARSVDDYELLSLCKVVETYEATDVPALIDRIKTKTIGNPADADVILTTTHKAKGLEFDRVKLADDFVPLLKNDEPVDPAKLDKEEINLLYVAVTRAKKGLELNENLEQFLSLINDG